MIVLLYLLSILYVPGTLIHELSHYFVARLLGVNARSINLIPRHTKKGFVFGSVQVARTGTVRSLIIGLAPFFVGLPLLIVLSWVAFYSSYGLPVRAFSGYLLLSVFNTMWPSRSDREGLGKALIYISIVALVCYFVFATISGYF